jgi:hypothetical protein
MSCSDNTCHICSRSFHLVFATFNGNSDSFLYCKQAIDKLPILPGFLEFVGILFSSVCSQYKFEGLHSSLSALYNLFINYLT